MARKRTMLYVEEDLMQQAREVATRTGRSEQEVVEDALVRYLGYDLLEQIWSNSEAEPLDEDEAMRIAYEELHAMREERDQLDQQSA